MLVAGLRGPATTDDVAVPAQDGPRRDDQTQASTAVLRDDIEQERDEGPVSPGQLGRARTWRCSTVSWWRGSRISADFHDSERRDSRSHPNSRLTIR
jgi:hypothetical protein